MKYTVFVDNRLQLRGKYPLQASLVGGKWVYHEVVSRKEVRDVTSDFVKSLRKLFKDSSQHYLKPFSVRRNFPDYFMFDVNEVLRILHIKSELYQLQVKLFEEYDDDRRIEMLNQDHGVRENLIPFFLEDQERFLVQAFENFSLIVNYIEFSRNAAMASNTYNMGIAFFVEDKRWMNLINLKMVSVDNPFYWLMKRQSIRWSTLVKFLTDAEDIDRNFTKPQVFKVGDRSGNMTFYCATSKDILELLNVRVDRYTPIPSAFAVQLMASAMMRALGFEIKTEFLPSNNMRYYTRGEEGNVIASSWDRNDLEGDVYEMNMMLVYLQNQLGASVAGRVFPDFERMRLT